MFRAILLGQNMKLHIYSISRKLHLAYKPYGRGLLINRWVNWGNETATYISMNNKDSGCGIIPEFDSPLESVMLEQLNKDSLFLSRD